MPHTADGVSAPVANKAHVIKDPESESSGEGAHSASFPSIKMSPGKKGFPLATRGIIESIISQDVNLLVGTFAVHFCTTFRSGLIFLHLVWPFGRTCVISVTANIF